MIKVARISAMALTLWASAVSAWAADGSSKAVFAYGAINAYMTTTWVAREQGFFRKHSVEVEPVFIIASRAAQASVSMLTIATSRMPYRLMKRSRMSRT